VSGPGGGEGAATAPAASAADVAGAAAAAADVAGAAAAAAGRGGGGSGRGGRGGGGSGRGGRGGGGSGRGGRGGGGSGRGGRGGGGSGRADVAGAAAAAADVAGAAAAAADVAGAAAAAAGPPVSAWLVTGDDPSLVTEAVGNLVAKLIGPADRPWCWRTSRARNWNWARWWMPAGRHLLADRRVVVVRTPVVRLDQLQPIISYLEDPLPTTRLVVAGGGGQLPAKFVAAFRQSPAAEVISTDVSSKEAHGG